MGESRNITGDSTTIMLGSRDQSDAVLIRESCFVDLILEFCWERLERKDLLLGEGLRGDGFCVFGFDFLGPKLEDR